MELSGRAAALVDRYVAWIVEERPVEATRLGDHSRDGDLPELSPRSVDGWIRSLSELRSDVHEALEAGPEAAGTEQLRARGDLTQLVDAIEARLFLLEERRQYATDPLVGLNVATDGIDELLRRARLAHRDGDDIGPWVASLRSRLAQVPRAVEQAAGLLEGSSAPGRTVALSRIGGVRDLFERTLPEALEEMGVRRASDAELGDAAGEAVTAYAALLEELGDQDALPWRLGPEQHATALRTALGSRMPADEVRQRARDAFTARRHALAEEAGSLWAALGLPGRPPADPVERSREALEAVSRERSQRDGLVADARAAVADAIRWCEASGVVEVPDTSQLAIDEVPEHLQGLFVAYLEPAPPLEPDAGSTYFLSPVPDDWDDERATSFLKEYNRASLHALAVHEAYPGHFLQLERASRHPRLARRLLGSSAFAEGWAVYTEAMVQEVAGAHAGDPVLGIYAEPTFRLVELKMQLRVAANALLDTGLHAGDLDDDGAMQLMVHGAYQEEAEAAGKLVRAKVTSGQLCSYFVGGEEVADLRAEIQRRWGADFTLRRFHDAVLAHGTPPVSVLRDELVAPGR